MKNILEALDVKKTYKVGKIDVAAHGSAAEDQFAGPRERRGRLVTLMLKL